MKGTVLVVDDTPTNVQVLVECLSTAGYRALVAEDGESALDQLQHTLPDIILLDVMMPGIDGFETCRRLKARPEVADIPVIFMTAVTEISNKIRGFEVGAVDYITKPYHHGEVLSRVATQLTLRRQHLELQAMLEQRAKFMRIAAHDLRNPLTAVVAWTDLALEDARAAGLTSMENMLVRIKASANRTSHIIEDFLNLQVLRAGGSEYRQEPFDLAEVVMQVVDQHRYAAEQKKIGLEYTPPASATRAVGHPAHTNQILTNYVSNAIKYSPPGRCVMVAVKPGGPGWRVEVQDQGPGIQPKDRPSLFVEFARIPNKPTGGETSTGLGLAIVKHLAEVQGGKVGADFPAEGGSVFWLEIPAERTNA